MRYILCEENPQIILFWTNSTSFSFKSLRFCYQSKIVKDGIIIFLLKTLKLKKNFFFLITNTEGNNTMKIRINIEEEEKSKQEKMQDDGKKSKKE